MKRHHHRPRNNNNGGRRYYNHNQNRNNNSGPGNDRRIRNDAIKKIERYQNQAKDALTAGDLIAAENFYQHADHYQRVADLHTPPEELVKKQEGEDADGEESGDDNTATESNDTRQQSQRAPAGTGDQPTVDGDAFVSEKPHHNKPRRQYRDNKQDTDVPADSNVVSEDVPKPKRRGRPPRKVEAAVDAPVTGEEGLQVDFLKAPVPIASEAAATESAVDVGETPKPKKRGRPRKIVEN